MVNIIETNLEFGELTRRSNTNLIVVHHVGEINRDVTAKEIHGWHLNNGWSGIGYHFVIRKNGQIERGRPEWAVGSHAYGCNYNSIGINIVGDFEQAKPTQAQIESAAMLIGNLATKYNIVPTAETVVGHRDLMETACPGKNLYKELQTLRGKAIWYQHH